VERTRTQHPWILVVDVDERVKPDLQQEIEAALADPGARDG